MLVSDVSRVVTDYLRGHLGPDITIGHEEDLFASGLASSLIALQLVVLVEHEFALTVEDDDLNLDNFRSVAAIERFVVRKCGIRAPAADQ
jgi:methoxymalonate biosynthesis acyl carrier protein